MTAGSIFCFGTNSCVGTCPSFNSESAQQLSRLQLSAAVAPPSNVMVTVTWKSMCLVVVSDFRIIKLFCLVI